MNDNLDELILLLLRTSGMQDAILTFQEETGVSQGEATTAVQELARDNGRAVRTVAKRVIESMFAVNVTDTGRNLKNVGSLWDLDRQ